MDELWELLQIPKENYSRAKGEVHCEDDWKVKNSEGNGSGALQYKVWKPGRLHPTRNDYRKAFERL